MPGDVAASAGCSDLCLCHGGTGLVFTSILRLVYPVIAALTLHLLPVNILFLMPPYEPPIESESLIRALTPVTLCSAGTVSDDDMPVAPAAPEHTTRYDDDRPAAPRPADSQPPLPPSAITAPPPGPLSLYAAPPPLPVEQPVEQSRFDPESGVHISRRAAWLLV